MLSDQATERLGITAVTTKLGHWLVQVGKGSGSYETRYEFPSDQPTRARMYYDALNTHSGHKKRLVNPNGEVVARIIT